MRLISYFAGLSCVLFPFITEAANQPLHDSLNRVQRQQLAEDPPPPIPPNQRNVSFISRWVIFGTFFTQFMLKHNNAKFIEELDQAWNREILSILGSSTFKRFLTLEDLNILGRLLQDYKHLGKAYITKVLDSDRPNGFENLRNSWKQKGEEIALFFRMHQFDPFNELSHWFEKVTDNLIAEVQALVNEDLSDKKPGLFAEYGASIRNFEEIGFTLSPAP
jgi:hypothetical protein